MPRSTCSNSSIIEHEKVRPFFSDEGQCLIILGFALAIDVAIAVPITSCDNSQPFPFQLGVMEACQKLESALREIHVSEVLPAAHDLMFLNVTTLEGQPLCLERTHRGWRICSMKHDSMHGDLQHLDLHVLYFEDAEDAVAQVSPSCREAMEGSPDEGLQFDNEDPFHSVD